MKKKSMVAAALVLGILLGGAALGVIGINDWNKNAYVYSSEVVSVDGKPQVFWTLQIPNYIKFTYEKDQAARIDAFVRCVDDLNSPFGWTEENRSEAEAAFNNVLSISIP